MRSRYARRAGCSTIGIGLWGFATPTGRAGCSTLVVRTVAQFAPSDIQEADVFRIALDEGAPCLDVLTHQGCEDLIRRNGVIQRHLTESAGLGVHRRLPELLVIHLAE